VSSDSLGDDFEDADKEPTPSNSPISSPRDHSSDHASDPEPAFDSDTKTPDIPIDDEPNATSEPDSPTGDAGWSGPEDEEACDSAGLGDDDGPPLIGGLADEDNFKESGPEIPIEPDEPLDEPSIHGQSDRIVDAASPGDSDHLGAPMFR
jgi:hypothetical protein